MRYLVYSHEDNPLFELDETQLIEALQIETINAEHSLSLSTLQELEKEQRILIQDGAGKWREFVVIGISSEHAEQATINTYYCVWSLQHDLEGTKVSSMPGVQNPVTAKIALDHALAGTKRWATGSVTRNTTGGASMYFMSGWEALGKVVDVWGGEVDANITVDEKGVVSRAVDLYDKQGNQAAKRRFDYARDMTSIKREVSDDLFACRIIPRGKGEETESGGYGRKITIEDVNDGRDYLEDEEAAQLVRLPAGSGYEYPTLIVDNENIETPEALLEWAQSVLTEYTRPRVSYEADVVQLARAGMDITGVALGDAVQCVDKTFLDDGLRIEGRIVKIEENLLDSSDIKLTIGNLGTTLADQFSLLQSQVTTVQEYVQALQGDISTSEWIDNLLGRINAEVNATGGYTYITQGSGIRTYDKAVSDPLVGTEATSVVEIKGGTIRIANSKNAQGEWEWKTVFTSGHVAAELVTAANLTTGYIGSPTSGNYWNLDTGEFYSAAYATKDELASLEIGGANYLRGTNLAISQSAVSGSWDNGAWALGSGGSGTSQIVELTDPPIPTISYSRQIVGHTRGNRDYQQSAPYMEKDRTYTYSLYARAINGTQASCLCRVWLSTNSNLGAAQTHVLVGAGWQKITKTFTYTADVQPSFIGFGTSTLSGVTGDIEICAMKLEEGDFATDWTPNSWDTTAELEDTFATKTELQQTSSSIDARITTVSTTANTAATNASTALSTANTASSNASTALSTANTEKTTRETLIRAYGNGVLAAKVGQNRGALVNADGSFDVVVLTWSGNTPTVGAKLSSFGATTTSLGANSNSAVIDMCNGLGKISQEKVNSTTYFSIASDYEYMNSKYSSQLVSRANSNDLYGSKVKAQLGFGERYIYEAEMEAYDYTNDTGSSVSGYMAGGHIYINGLGYLDITATGEGHITTPKLYLNNVDIVPYLTDSGWLNLSIVSPFTAYDTSRTPKYRRVGKMVQLVGAVKPTETLPADNTQRTFGTLPAGYRPQQTITELCQGSGGAQWLLQVGTKGNCTASRYRNGSTNASAGTSTWLTFNTTFFVA